MATIITQAEFSERQTEGFNRIPVSRCVLADAETPLSAYAKLAQGPLIHHRLAGKNLVNR